MTETILLVKFCKDHDEGAVVNSLWVPDYEAEDFDSEDRPPEWNERGFFEAPHRCGNCGASLSVSVLDPSRLLPEDEERVECEKCGGEGYGPWFRPNHWSDEDEGEVRADCSRCLGTGYRLVKRQKEATDG